MKRVLRKNFTRKLRKNRVRGRVGGTASRPRLSIFRSNANLYCQLIDDVAGKTLLAGSLKDVKAAPTKAAAGAQITKALELGKLIAEKAKKAGISAVVLDRGQYAYHGRVKAIAEGARAGGLKL